MTQTHSPSAEVNEEALAAFLARRTEINLMLAQLAERSDEFFGVGPDEIHWGHVGDLGRIAEHLKRALGQEG